MLRREGRRRCLTITHNSTCATSWTDILVSEVMVTPHTGTDTMGLLELDRCACCSSEASASFTNSRRFSASSAGEPAGGSLRSGL